MLIHVADPDLGVRWLLEACKCACWFMRSSCFKDASSISFSNGSSTSATRAQASRATQIGISNLYFCAIE